MAASGDSASSSTQNTTTNRNWVDWAIYSTRVGILITCMAFLVAPLFGGAAGAQSAMWYQRAMLLSAATAALRQHQRIAQMAASDTPFQFSKESFLRLLSDEPFHYLMYSVLFVLFAPVTVALVPIFLFALLHSVAFTKKICSSMATGDSVPTYHRFLMSSIEKVEANQQQLLSMVALNEVMLMPVTIMLVFSGSHSLLLPIIYYRFLKLRYNSQRNPYCRRTFTELRYGLERVAAHQYCPQIVNRIIYGVINVVCRLGGS